MLLQLGPDLLLRFTAPGFPIEVKYFAHRAQVLFWVAMAIQAPAHGQRLVLINDIHVIDLPVATDAADPTVHMNPMVKIRKIRYLMYPNPMHGLPGLPTLLHGPELRIILLYLLMTIHAGLGGRYIRSRRHLYVRVTISAIHAQLVDMHVVRKCNRLDRLIPLPHVFWRQIPPVGG